MPRIPDAWLVGTLALLDQNHDHWTEIDGDDFGDFAQELGEARIRLLSNVCGETEYNRQRNMICYSGQEMSGTNTNTMSKNKKACECNQ